MARQNDMLKEKCLTKPKENHVYDDCTYNSFTLLNNIIYNYD